jgi:hypothetical protein
MMTINALKEGRYVRILKPVGVVWIGTMELQQVCDDSFVILFGSMLYIYICYIFFFLINVLFFSFCIGCFWDTNKCYVKAELCELYNDETRCVSEYNEISGGVKCLFLFRREIEYSNNYSVHTYIIYLFR